MTEPTLPRWQRLVRSIRRVFPWWPASRGPRADRDGDPDLRGETSRVQLELVRQAFARDGFSGHVGRGPEEDAYLCHNTRVMVRAKDVGRLEEFFEQRRDVYEDGGRVTGELVGDLLLYELPAKAREGRADVPSTLDEIDAAMQEQGIKESIARPDHIVYVTPGGIGKMCPATEPELPLGKGPLPPPSRDQGRGKGVRVSVVDTGWYAAAATNPETPWLGGITQADLETVDPANIHPYAGHGTFVTGIIRCLAPAVEVEVEGVLTRAGAVYESTITRELNEAMTDRDKPDLISISAGAYTRNDAGMLGFEVLSELYDLTEGEDAVLVVAAAGNDSSKRPFWPAAYPWVVSVGALDADMCVSDFSNYGTWVDVYAHGRDLVNAFPTGTYTCHEPKHLGEVRSFTGMAQWSGTSFATPVVTGVIAAHMSEHGVSARHARDALIGAGQPVTDPVGNARVAVGPPFA